MFSSLLQTPHHSWLAANQHLDAYLHGRLLAPVVAAGHLQGLGIIDPMVHEGHELLQ